jgi:hypothetical protein
MERMNIYDDCENSMFIMPKNLKVSECLECLDQAGFYGFWLFNMVMDNNRSNRRTREWNSKKLGICR